jgi:hypothetical protein
MTINLIVNSQSGYQNFRNNLDRWILAGADYLGFYGIIL